MDKTESLTKGYIAFGYISPELSSNDEYPDYIKEDAQRCIKEVKEIQNENTFSFGYMTDLHYSLSENHDVRTKRLFNSYKEVSDAVNADKLILGGDYINDGDKENYKAKGYRGLRDYLREVKNYYPVNGNHDDNSIWDAFCGNHISKNHFTIRELYDIFYDHLPYIGAEFDEKNHDLYYLVNDNKNKVRYIFLNTTDVPSRLNKNGAFTYRKQDVFGLRQPQVDWLINTALNFEEDGWSVVFVAHSLKETNLEVLVEIADAYKNGGKVNKLFKMRDYYVFADADFSVQKRAEVVGFFLGHYHDDFTERTPGGIPCIYIANVMMYLPNRVDGTKTELLYDIVTIEKKTKTIYLNRVGLGENRVVKY